jgi:4-amino-4-deoxy-L-arabinose transferase-like glycosyltransferase
LNWAVFRIFGYGYAAAAVRNSVRIAGFGLLYASFPAAAVALGLGPGAGVIAGIGAALFPSFRSREMFAGRDEWAVALLLLWLTILVHRISTRAESRIGDAIIFGVGWGLLLLMQPSTVTVLPAHALLCLLYSGRGAFKKRLGQGLLAAAIVILMLTPWTIRNYLTMGAWFFVRDDFGLELHIAQSDNAQPSQLANQRTGWYCTVHPNCSAPALDEIRRVGEVSFNRRLLREALSWIAAHPKRFRELTLARIAAFWADLPPNPSTPVRLLWSLLGWLGIFLMWRAGYRLQTLLLASILVIYPLVYYTVQYLNRYVSAICFAIFLPAGFAVDRLFSFWSLRSVRLR